MHGKLTSRTMRQSHTTFTKQNYPSLLHKDLSLASNSVFTLSIHPIPDLSICLNSLTPDLVIFFTNSSSYILSIRSNNRHTTLWSIQAANSFTSLVFLRTSSLLTLSLHITPHMLLRDLISITFNLLYAALLFQVSVSCIAVRTPAPWNNILCNHFWKSTFKLSFHSCTFVFYIGFSTYNGDKVLQPHCNPNFGVNWNTWIHRQQSFTNANKAEKSYKDIKHTSMTW